MEVYLRTGKLSGISNIDLLVCFVTLFENFSYKCTIRYYVVYVFHNDGMKSYCFH